MSRVVGSGSAIALATSIESAGFDPATQVGMSIDVAASQFYRDGAYQLKAEGRAVEDRALGLGHDG